MKQILWVILMLAFALGIKAQDQSDRQRPKIGLVLGGGGAKGAAEVGVLKVMEEAGIAPDYIAGTSIGAIIGALYSVGYRSEQLDSLFRTQEWLDLFANGNITGVFERLVGVRGDVDFLKLPIPFSCVAVDMQTQREVVLQEGDLPLSMRASMAIPGLFMPVKINGRMLVDGGVMNNLPVDVVKSMGADVVIAVDLTQNKHETREFSLKDLLGIGGWLDWLVSRPDWKKYNKNRQAADVYINPPLGGYGATSFNKKSIEAMILAGEKAGREKMEELRHLASEHALR